MRHDAKLGLASGMLVVGFAVAFCFPRPDEQAPQKPAPVPPPIADATLALLPIRTYQTGIAERFTPAQPTPPLGGQETLGSRPAVTPVLIDGVPLTATHLTAKPEPPGQRFEKSLIAQPVASSNRTEVAEESKSGISNSPQGTYLVKPGDTLMAIATSVLGSSARYGELFAANQDILSSPHDLKIGMTLRIPPLVPPRGEPTLEPSSAVTIQRDASRLVPSLPHSSQTSQFQRPPPWIAEQPRDRRTR